MLIETTTSTLERGNVATATAFRINASASAFKILSSGLYSNKIAAVLRELSCNAVDANRAAGNHLPITVKLPGVLDSRFYVQDGGLGMSDDFLRKNYTTYFESTKSGDNNAIGGFGLGSKSPFAYTDQFTVESVYEGTHRTYTAYLDDEGAPCISLMSTAPASEEWPRGTRVSLPIDRKDTGDFETTAKDVFQYFDQSPVTPYGKPITAPKEYHTRTANLGFAGVAQSNYYYNQKLTAVMGGVAYSIDMTQLEKALNAPLWKIARALSTQGTAIFFDIGDVQVTPSREALDYSAFTKRGLKQKFDLIEADIAVELGGFLNLPRVTMSEWVAIFKQYRTVSQRYGVTINESPHLFGLPAPSDRVWRSGVPDFFESEDLRFSTFLYHGSTIAPVHPSADGAKAITIYSVDNNKRGDFIKREEFHSASAYMPPTNLGNNQAYTKTPVVEFLVVPLNAGKTAVHLDARIKAYLYDQKRDGNFVELYVVREQLENDCHSAAFRDSVPTLTEVLIADLPVKEKADASAPKQVRTKWLDKEHTTLNLSGYNHQIQLSQLQRKIYMPYTTAWDKKTYWEDAINGMTYRTVCKPHLVLTAINTLLLHSSNPLQINAVAVVGPKSADRFKKEGWQSLYQFCKELEKDATLLQALSDQTELGSLYDNKDRYRQSTAHVLFNIAIGEQFPEMRAAIRPILNASADWVEFEESTTSRRTTERVVYDTEVVRARRTLAEQNDLLNLPTAQKHENFAKHVDEFCQSRWPALDLIHIDSHDKDYFTPQRSKAMTAALAHILN